MRLNDSLIVFDVLELSFADELIAFCVVPDSVVDVLSVPDLVLEVLVIGAGETGENSENQEDRLFFRQNFSLFSLGKEWE